MEHWPLFEERYVAEVLSGPPAYLDGLLTIVLLLSLVLAGLWTVSRSAGVRHLRAFRVVYGAANVLFALAIGGLIYGLMEVAGQGMVDFWRRSAWGMLYGAGFFVVMTLGYVWIWFTFDRGNARRGWYARYFQLWGWAGAVLLIPLGLALVGNTPRVVLRIVLVVIYVLFKVLVVVHSLRTFNHVLRYPLHIILYLCGCEVLPLLFVCNGMVP